MSLYISPAYSFSSKLFVHLFLSFPSPCHLLGEGDCFLLYIPVHLFISSFGDSDFLFIYIFGVCVAVTANPSLFCSLYICLQSFSARLQSPASRLLPPPLLEALFYVVRQAGHICCSSKGGERLPSILRPLGR